MPLQYTHANVSTPETKYFRCNLQCEQCKATTPSGRQCERRVCKWLPYCWQHSRLLLGVRTDISQALPGDTGLYALRSFQKGEMVAPYGGERLTESQINERYGREGSIGPYLLNQVDSGCRRFIASAPNGAFGTVDPSRANIHFAPTQHLWEQGKKQKAAGEVYKDLKLTRGNLGIKMWAVASRNIKEGEEIIADYGDEHDYVDTFMRRMKTCDERGVVCDVTR